MKISVFRNIFIGAMPRMFYFWTDVKTTNNNSFFASNYTFSHLFEHLLWWTHLYSVMIVHINISLQQKKCNIYILISLFEFNENTNRWNSMQQFHIINILKEKKLRDYLEYIHSKKMVIQSRLTDSSYFYDTATVFKVINFSWKIYHILRIH